ncbi:protein of unknown function [Blastococcus saxobsidens DD2]|uniref:Uncharacterized protein n=1 Tax=Blastococcus saxobsidens (strain DD2) TaxID=1146883 RepID=H6RJC0_BLASD|nr:protein of unknown function [Blastococcus saxobsidens DD2]
MTSAFIDGCSRLSLAGFGRIADHLRTLCGLGAPQQSLGPCPDGLIRAYTRRSLSDCASRRKGASRPCGMGLRPTLPPARCSQEMGRVMRRRRSGT